MYLALLLSLPSALALQATITPPAILPRQEVANSATPEFIGYTYESAKWAKWDCREGSAFLTSGSFGRCAATATESFIPTGCTRGSVMVGESSSSTCTGSAAQTSCVAGTIYHYIGDRSPINNYQCWPAWNGGSWDATIATTVPPSTLSSSTIASQTSSSSPSPTSSIASETAPPQQTSPASTPELEPVEEKKSQAWIAGPVIGGIAAIALLGAGFFFWRRKQAKKPYTNMAHEMGGESKGASVYAYNADGTWKAPPGGAMPGSTYAPAELPTQTRNINELDGASKLTAVEADGRAVGK